MYSTNLVNTASKILPTAWCPHVFNFDPLLPGFDCFQSLNALDPIKKLYN